ncbi:hypothetical protein ONA92_03980 [Mycobacteroides salmoniphilum]|uniref:hypothetical protein n=1 Tax=Mycobacteroides salmoniphilum TaxID=404941 RepID=UPI0035628D39
MVVLGLLGGIANLAIAAALDSSIGYISVQDDMPDWYGAKTYVVVGVGVIVAVALLTGAAMTFSRKWNGPRVVTVGVCCASLSSAG